MCGECHAQMPDSRAPASPCHPDFPFVLGAATSYEDKTLQSLVHHLKFRSIHGAARPLGELLFNYTRQAKLDLAGFVVLPIPLSRRRERARGYNQAERIAKYFAERMALPLETHLLVRAKHAKPQSETKSEHERKENIRGAFALADPAFVRGKNIVLIDDVSTSGSTFSEASRMLKTAGAAKIMALAVAKT